MKSRIGTINRKPIVQGDKNLVTPNEIHVSELEGRGQTSVPVEYYKVAVPEGSSDNIEDVRVTVSQSFIELLQAGFNYNVLIKGTSSSSGENLYTGVSIMMALSVPNPAIHAYAFIPSGMPGKLGSNGGTNEYPSFDSVLDTLAFIGREEVKQFLVPITAEEFYNLDDMQ